MPGDWSVYDGDLFHFYWPEFKHALDLAKVLPPLLESSILKKDGKRTKLRWQNNANGERALRTMLACFPAKAPGKRKEIPSKTRKIVPSSFGKIVIAESNIFVVDAISISASHRK